MRQLLYVSTSAAANTERDLDAILAASRRNNGLDGITGLLWTDDRRFLQVLEGPADVIEGTFDRIRADPRHRAIVVLSDRVVEAREFGDWTMATRETREPADQFDDRLAVLLADASDDVRGTFTGMVAARRG